MKLLTPSLLILAAFVFGGMMFKSMAPVNCGTILPNDRVFVLTGDVRRIPFAMRMLHAHPDIHVYIIGAGGGTYYNPPHIIVESESKSTYQNAVAIKNIAIQKNLDRLVVITTEDHMNRAMYLIGQELPNTEIVACPTRLFGMPPAKRLERWATEYVKYVVTMFGIKES
ncbi:MAG: YdcF family protein [Alphaproteobacteria bacterium]|nr:YdcF family protein [Alphaproteobacteria bacterium]